MMKKSDQNYIPIYFQISESLKERISSGVYPENSKLPGEIDLATDFGVNRHTVRKSLDKLVKEGYVRKINGRGTFVMPNPQLGRTIILVGHNLETWTHESMQKVSCGAMVRLKKSGFYVELETFDNVDFVLEEHQAGKKKVNGAIILRAGLDSEDLMNTVTSKIDKTGIPCIFEGNGPRLENRVVLDNQIASKKIVDHLFDLGHREIGFVYSASNNCDEWSLRHEYFKSMLDAKGCNYKGYTCEIKEPIYEAVDRISEIESFLRRRKRPTAVICFGDTVAVNLINIAKELGLEIPNELSVIGFDNLPICGFCRPTLTSVTNDYWRFGYVAAENLIEQINCYSAKGKTTFIEPELIVRESTTPPGGWNDVNRRQYSAANKLGVKK